MSSTLTSNAIRITATRTGKSAAECQARVLSDINNAACCCSATASLSPTPSAVSDANDTLKNATLACLLAASPPTYAGSNTITALAQQRRFYAAASASASPSAPTEATTTAETSAPNEAAALSHNNDKTSTPSAAAQQQQVQQQEQQQQTQPLTIYDPNNALVRALFAVQQKYNIFNVGDTVVDVGCLPGTSSRCIRQWIDGGNSNNNDGEGTAASNVSNHTTSAAAHHTTSIPFTSSDVTAKTALNNSTPSSGTTGTSASLSLRRSAAITTTTASGSRTVRYPLNDSESAIDEIIAKSSRSGEGSPSVTSVPHWRCAVMDLKNSKKKTKNKNNSTSSNKLSALSNPPTDVVGADVKSPGTRSALAQQQQPQKGFIVGIDALRAPTNVNDDLPQLTASSTAESNANNSNDSPTTTNKSEPTSTANSNRVGLFVGDVLISKTIQELCADIYGLEKASGGLLRRGAGVAASTIPSGCAMLMKARSMEEKENDSGNGSSTALLQDEHDGKADVVFIDLCPLLEKELADAATQLIGTLSLPPPPTEAAAATSNNDDDSVKMLDGASDTPTADANKEDDTASSAAQQQQLVEHIQEVLSHFHPMTHPQYYTRVSIEMLRENQIAAKSNQIRKQMRLNDRKMMEAEALESSKPDLLRLSNRLDMTAEDVFALQQREKLSDTSSFEVLMPKTSSSAGGDYAATSNTRGKALITTSDPSAAHDMSAASGQSEFFDVVDNTTPLEALMEHAEAILGANVSNSMSSKNNNDSAVKYTDRDGKVKTIHGHHVSRSLNAVAKSLGSRVEPNTIIVKRVASGSQFSGTGADDPHNFEGSQSADDPFRRATTDVIAMHDDSSGSGKINYGVTNRINFYDYPLLLKETCGGKVGIGGVANNNNNNSNNGALAMFRPTPLTPDALFMTALESIAAAVRLTRPYLKPFKERSADDEKMNQSSIGGKQEQQVPKKKSAGGGTSGKLLIRLIFPTEAVVNDDHLDNNNDSTISTNEKGIVLASSTRRNGHTLATSLGAISGSYHAFIDSLQQHFSFVDVVDKRTITVGCGDDGENSGDSNAFSSGASSPLAPFTSYTQLLILAHNSNTPIVAGEQALAARGVRDNPAFVLFDREVILTSEAMDAINDTKRSGGAGTVGGTIGNRRMRAHSLKHDLPSSRIVLPTTDGLGNAYPPSNNSTSSWSAGTATSDSNGSKQKFRGVYKYLSQTTTPAGAPMNLSPDAPRSKMRHSSWSPNRGYYRSPEHGASLNTVTAISKAYDDDKSLRIASSSNNSSSDTNNRLSGGRDTFSALTSFKGGGATARPASLSLVGQNVSDASTRTFVASLDNGGRRSKTPANEAIGASSSSSPRKLSLTAGNVVNSHTVASASGSSSGLGIVSTGGAGSANSRSVSSVRSRFFKSRYPTMLQAPPPAEELQHRVDAAAKREQAFEDAQDRFNRFKMETIDARHMQDVIGEHR